MFKQVAGTVFRRMSRKAPLYARRSRLVTRHKYHYSTFRRMNIMAMKNKGIHQPYSSLIFKRQFAATTVNVPNMGDSISEGTLVEWTKNVGDACQVDDIVAVIETDKVTIDVRTDHAGVITEQLASIDDTLEVGAPLFTIDSDATATSSSSSSSSSEASSSSSSPSSSEPSEAAKSESSSSQAAPAAAAAAAPPKQQQQQAQAPKAASSAPTTPSMTMGGMSRSENRVSMSRMRLRIAERLKEAQTNAACLTTFNEIDMSNLMSMRSQYKDLFFEKHGIKLGFMSAFVKASCSALEEQPAVNAYIEGKEIVYHNYCDVSVAVASPTGLVVPVIRNAQSLSFSEIESEIMNYAKKAKDGSLTVNEMTGGTFTISNGGVFGSLMGTPILNPPQSAILGMHGVFERPVAVKGNIEIKPMMYVALTYDHRIIDGREAVLFLRRIKDCVEDPRRMLLNV